VSKRDPEDFIVEWRAQTRWANDAQVEQDLVLSRALAVLFADAGLADAVALRGGTALRKLHFVPARRYSEDIDLVQLRPGPMGPILDRLRGVLDPWLGEPRRDHGQGVRLVYRFDCETPPVVRQRLLAAPRTTAARSCTWRRMDNVALGRYGAGMFAGEDSQ
jgi:hypothetical protein